MDLVTSLGLVICNRGNSPTFQRGNTVSIVDITLGSPGLVTKMMNWEVSAVTTLSDHNYIKFTLQSPSTDPNTRGRKLKLDYRKLEESLRTGALINGITLDAEGCATSFSAKIREVCGTETPTTSGKRKSVYWWTPAISAFRKQASKPHTKGPSEEEKKSRVRKLCC